MNRKWNYESVKEYFLKKEYELISKSYTNVDELLSFKDAEGYLYIMTFYSFKTGNKPQKFRPNNPYTLYNIDLLLKSKGFNLEIVSNIYKGVDSLIDLKDEEGYYYQTTISGLLANNSPRAFDYRNKYTIQNISTWLNNNNINLTLVSKSYKRFNLKLTFKDCDGYLYETSVANLLKLHPPDKFNTSNKHTINNIKLWCKLNNIKFKLLSNKYNNNSTPLKWSCIKNNCQEIFEMSWDRVSQFNGCPYCAGIKVGKSNCLATKNPELAKEWNLHKNGELTPETITCGSGLKVWWVCRDCGYEWRTTTPHRIEGTGCPSCKISRGERKIKSQLTFNNINFEVQKTFKNLLGAGNGLLSYDFYLPDHNLLIEYQGEFHDREVYDGHDFERQKEHDKRKREYANKNKIKLLEIWYWDFENVEKILNKELGFTGYDQTRST